MSAERGGSRVLRLLCLHGYRQNADSFRARSGALRKVLRKHAELLIVVAPHAVAAQQPQPGPNPIQLSSTNAAMPVGRVLHPAVGGGQSQRPPQGEAASDLLEADSRGWWFSNLQEGTFNAVEEASSCTGLEESLDLVARAFVEYGPIDGLLGFSQGAALVGIICALKQRGDSRFPFDFAIMIAGFKSQAAAHHSYYQEPITVPSLHVLGETDRVIPAEMSRELASVFTEPVVLTHPGGHFMAASSPQKKAYLEFLNQFLK